VTLPALAERGGVKEKFALLAPEGLPQAVPEQVQE
jgi:hypothetical protein